MSVGLTSSSRHYVTSTTQNYPGRETSAILSALIDVAMRMMSETGYPHKGEAYSKRLSEAIKKPRGLNFKGKEPTMKLALCQGDCDTNENCQSGLECFHRSGFTSVPGCAGVGEYNADYCYNPINPRLPPLEGVYLPPGPLKGAPLGMCEGDCDTDSECQEGFACFQRDGLTSVPGCSGQGSKDADYCYAPELNDFGKDPKQNLGQCAGDCDANSNCADGLKCFQRDAFEAVPGCEGHGATGYDYGYKPAEA